MTHITIEKAKLEFVLEALESLYPLTCGEEITAIKQARAAPVQSCYCPNCEAMGKELAALKAQQPVQQPVAWLYPEGLEALQNGKCWTAYPTKHDGCNIPLCAPPAAQPAPVPLTDMAKILVDRLAEEQAVYLSMETAKSFVKSMLAAALEKGQP